MENRPRKSLARSNSGIGRKNADDPQQSSIRFDYSSIYFDNEELDDELENKKTLLYRAKQKASIESEVNLMAAKKDADEMLSLKEKIQNRDKDESSKRVLKSAEHCKRKGRPGSCKTLNGTVQDHGDAAPGKPTTQTFPVADDVDSSSHTASTESDGPPPAQRKPLNTLTMYLLAMQDFKRGCLRKDEDRKEKKDKRDENLVALIQGLTRPTTQPARSKRPTSFRVGSVRAATAHVARSRHSATTAEVGPTIHGEPTAYGIHVRKDFTRSRRKLEEISKLEQDAKFGYVDKYEQRRQRLLAACKDTELLDLRVQRFLKNVEEFNERNTPKNPLDRLLMRSKSATYRRDAPFL